MLTREALGSRRWVLVLAIVLVGIHVALAWVSRGPGISWGEDDAQYIVLAGELQHGSYAERWDVDAPTHARFPPGFPALLTIANVLTGGGGIGVYTLIVLLCSAASIALFFLVVRRHFGDGVALFVTGLTAINAVAVTDAGYIMAEAPFRLWVTLVLWSASRENPRRQHLVLAGASAVIAALTRSVGVAVIAGLALHWLLERRWKAVALLAAGSVPVGLWLVWTVVAPDPDQRSLYLHTVLVHNSPTIESQDSFWVEMLRRMQLSIERYGRTLVPKALSFFGLKENPLDNLAWVALVLVTVPLGMLVSWRRWRLLVLVLLSYIAALVVWPWRNERFVSPVTSVLLVIIGAGVLHLLRRQSARTQHLALAGVASLFVVGSIQAGGPVLKAMLACDRTRPLDSSSCLTEDRRGLLRLTAYVRENTPPEARFLTSKEGAFYLHSGRQTVRRNRFGDVPPDSLGAVLRRNGVSYAVVTPIGIAGDRYNSLVANACRDFTKVVSFEGDAVLLRVREDGPIDHDDETCELIAKWKN